LVRAAFLNKILTYHLNRAMTVKPPTSVAPRKSPSLAAVRRAVASSTAIETGESIQKLERKLAQGPAKRFAHIGLATQAPF